jgi:hypothetical protein
MKRQSWKMGSQLEGNVNPDFPTFEWNLCYSVDRRLVTYVPLGIHNSLAPVVKAGHELVKLLNEAEPEV